MTVWRPEYGGDFDWQYLERSDWCANALRRRDADIWVSSQAWVQNYLISFNQCTDLHRAEWFEVFPKRVYLWLADADFAHQISLAINHIQSPPIHTWLEQDAFQYGKVCTATESKSASIDAPSMSGLFIIWGAITALAVVIACALRMRRDCPSAGDGGDLGVEEAVESVDSFATDGEMLRYLIRKIDAMSQDLTFRRPL